MAAGVFTSSRQTEGGRIMPGGDRTGPMGMGPMTGRGRGWCGRQGGSLYGGRNFGMFGWGRGRGWRHRYYATGAPGWARPGWGTQWAGPSPYWDWTAGQDELNELKDYAAGLERELSDIKARMAELEKERPSS